MNLFQYIETIKDKKITVIGAGVSNMPLIRTLLMCGCSVTVRDKRSIETMGMEALSLINQGARLKLGEDYLDGITEDVIFRTPGLMPFDPHLTEAAARGSVLTSEMEIFFRVCPCHTVAVTGSDGKTTTSTILAELLTAAGKRVHLGGNIGTPLLCESAEMLPTDYAVLELSSFQLHSMICKPEISVITNISPNHLDKHKDYQDYIDAKRAIFENQDEGDRLILNAADGQTPYYRSGARAQVAYFSDSVPIENGVFADETDIYRVHDGQKTRIMKKSEIRIPGEHNVQNYMAAFAALDGIVSDEICREVAMRFAGVEHRLELVRELRGVKYINDSIGSSPSRTVAGLHAMPVKPIVIAGGYDKCIPFDTLGDELCLRAKHVILTGATAEKIRTAIESSSHYADSGLRVDMVEDFKEAVLLAHASAQSGDIVLLSPACAAFDRFKNFAERGKYFKEIVMELT